LEEDYFKRTGITVLLCFLIVLCFFLLKPILLSIIIGMLLAFIFSPIYNWVYKKTNSKNLSATLICVVFALLLLACVWFFTPVAIDQSLKIYTGAQQMDYVSALKSISPSFFASEQFSREVGSIIKSFITRSANSLTTSFSSIILEFPTLFLHFLVVFFTFFYALRDKEEIGRYIKSLSPFSEEVDHKFFEYSKGITSSVLYGTVVVGFVQGLIVGISLFIFKVPNALLLTLLAIIAGIVPFIGPALIWLPVTIYLFIAQNPFQAIGVAIFGFIASSLENLLRPLIVSRRTSMPSSLIFLGMIGGFFLFGILGFLLGPLAIAYLIIFLELYRAKKSSN
jgi:predicted PurR-regulated permease PerM